MCSVLVADSVMNRSSVFKVNFEYLMTPLLDIKYIFDMLLTIMVENMPNNNNN